jgi:hypothetical protein
LNTIEGTIDNPLGVPLSDCVVLYGDSAYPLGEVAAGQPIRITRDAPWRTIRSYFGSAAQIGFRNEAQAWDAETREPLEVLRVMLFYSAIDGYRYTRRMVNNYQRFVDLSPVLAGGRAVFLGYGPVDRPAVRLAGEDQPLGRADNQARAVYRIVVPVERAPAP